MKFGKHLESQSTLQNWYKVIDGKPGICPEALHTIENEINAAAAENKHLHFALMLDAMCIRKQVLWLENKQKFVGYVDYGEGMSCKSDQKVEATSALVFLVQGVNKNFKMPVAYFLTTSMEACDQAKLVGDVLKRLHEIGANVVSLTFDGNITNIKTATELGADIWNANQLNPTFKHPSTGRPIEIFIDICHAIKLVRNVFGTKGFIYDKNGGIIKWDHIVKLNALQQNQELHAAN